MIQTISHKMNNYLVPSDGKTHAVIIDGVFSAIPFVEDWRSFSIDNFPFQPQGVFVDNSQGTVPLVIQILPINYSMSIAAGATAQLQFPAPNGQSVSITGSGQAQLIFVDFPVLPGGNAVTLQGTPTVDINSSAASPIYAVIPQNFGGLPYQTAPNILTILPSFLSSAGAGTSSPVPVGSTFLRSFILSVTSDAALITAGDFNIALKLNNNEIYYQTIYLPADPGTPATTSRPYIQLPVDFGLNGIPAAGNFQTILSPNLSNGAVQCTAYFT